MVYGTGHIVLKIAMNSSSALTNAHSVAVLPDREFIRGKDHAFEKTKVHCTCDKHSNGLRQICLPIVLCVASSHRLGIERAEWCLYALGSGKYSRVEPALVFIIKVVIYV